MKTKHPVRNMVILLSAILFFIVTAVGVLFGLKGYGMYKTAIAQAPIEETAEMIRTKEGFTHYSDLPVFYVDAVISTEDHRFREHCGIDFIAICRAVWTDIKALSFEEGGSTITQQLTKNLLFTQDKTIERKIAEVFSSLVKYH